MGISIRAYARSRGVSDTAVRKAVKTGRVTLELDGTVNPERADAQWQSNTDTAQQRKSTGTSQKNVPNAAMSTAREALGESPSPSTGGTTFVQARTANEVLKAQTSKVRLARLKNELIERSQAMAHVFKLARSERDAWLNWPARISAQMAADLNVDAHRMHITLEKAVRDHLLELGEMTPRVD